MGQAGTHGGQDVVGIILGGQIVQRNQPALGGPNRRLVHADGHDVELTAFGGDVLSDALAQHIFLKCHPLNLNARIGGGEVIGETLHADHVTVIHGCDGDGLGLHQARGRKQQGARERQAFRH